MLILGLSSLILMVRSAAEPGSSSTSTTLYPASDQIYSMLLLVGVGIAGTVGQVFLTKAYAAGMPSEVAVIGLTQVIFALLFDIIIWGRAMPPIALLGMALILAPTAWITRRARLTGSRSGPDLIPSR